MARFVELSPNAEASRTSLAAPIRRAINARIRSIAAKPDPLEADDWRLVAPGDSANSGLIAAQVTYGRRFFVIVYRIRRPDDTVWIEDIREIVIG